MSKSKLITLCEDLVRENLFLKLQLSAAETQNFPEGKTFKIGNFTAKPAKVIRRDIAGWSSELLVDIGSDDGIFEGMGVICQNHAIGRIKAVSPKASTVELITSPQFRMIVHAEKDAEGNPIIFVGDEKNMLGHSIGSAANVPASIVEDDREIVLVTSELSGVFPRNILIGTVKPPEEIFGNSFSAAVVLNDTLLSRLYEVAVLVKTEAR
jgi:rod shape-determining protein MreC